MLKFSQPTSADHESLIIWLEYVVTTRQSFGLEIILKSRSLQRVQFTLHTAPPLPHTHRYGGKGERL